MKIDLSPTANIKPLRPGAVTAGEQLASAKQLQKAYHDFVGKTFFGQMLKAMRSTVGKAAYFHGGQTEEMFRSQLDQHLADRMNESSAREIAEPMFRLQFPREAALVEDEAKKQASSLTDLSGLRRR